MPSIASDSIDCSMYGAWSKTTVNVAPGFVVSSEDSRSGSSARHRVRHLDGVRRGQLRDRDGERGLAVHARDARDGVVGQFDGCHVGDRRGDGHGDRGRRPVGRQASGRRAAGVGRAPRRSGRLGRASVTGAARCPEHRERRDVVDAAERVPVCTAKVESPSVMVPAGTSRPFCCSASRMACWVMPSAASFAGFGRDRDALADLADERRLAHAVDVGDLAERGALDLVGEGADVVDARDGDLQHGEVVEAQREHLRVDVLGQLAGDAVHGRQQLLLGEREVGAVGEARRDAREARRARRRRRLEPGDALDRGLDRGRDIRVHDVGRRARVARHDRELRELDRRRELLLEARERDPAEDRDDHGDERDERAVLHAERSKQVHCSILAGAWHRM